MCKQFEQFAQGEYSEWESDYRPPLSWCHRSKLEERLHSRYKEDKQCEGGHEYYRQPEPSVGEHLSVKSASKVSDIKLGGQANEVKCTIFYNLLSINHLQISMCLTPALK